MDDAIRASYIFMSESNAAELAPAGAVWRYLRENYPNINLYSGDGSHPSLAGSYAVACAFYTMIYKKDPTFISWNSTLNENEVNLIKTAAKTIVFDEISDWDFTLSPIADFSEEINNGEASFTHTGSDFESILWDFGDGNTSTETNPIHTFIENGIYEVSQTITKCEKSDTKTKTIEIITLHTERFNKQQFAVYPNPTAGKLTVNLVKHYKQVNISISSLSGKTLLKTTIKNSTNFEFNISTLSKGLYILKVLADDNVYIQKIVKE